MKGIEMSNLVKYTESELRAAGLFDKESDYGGMLGDAVLELVDTFSKQGHSGCSAGMALSIFCKVANFKPLSPLTFKDDEWGEPVHSDVFQNKRNSSVFKDGKDGKPRYIDAFYKKTETGGTCSGTLTVGDGRVLKRCYIKDPAKMPKICIDIIDWEVNKGTGEKEVGSGWWNEKMKNIDQLQELEKYSELEFRKE